MHELGKPIIIGYSPENNAREFVFDISDYAEKWPGAQPRVFMQRSGDTVPYIVDVSFENNLMTWCVSRYDTAIPGDGRMWVAFVKTENDVLGLAPSTLVRVLEGIPTLDAPEPPPTEAPWVLKVLEAAERIEQGGGSGMPGKDGGYYTPNVTDDGILTWEANKPDMPSVPSTNVKGADGYTPIKGVDYFDGKDGKSGVQLRGSEPTDLDVNVWIIPDGEPDVEPGGGMPGEDGGYYRPSVDAAGNLTWTASKPDMPDIPGANVKGDKGDAGYTPQRGTDYWTAADRQQMVSDVLAALPNASGVNF